MLGRIEGRRRRTTEDEMVGWHHQLNEHEFEQTQGENEGQERLACCSPWSHKESDMTQQLNKSNSIFNNNLTVSFPLNAFKSNNTFTCVAVI